MSKTPVELWLEALEGGRYKQVQRSLTALDRDGHIIGHCCLGVACSVYQKHGPGDLEIASEFASEDAADRVYDGHSDVLPEKVRDWLGLATDSGEFWEVAENGYGREEEYGVSLVEKNDENGLDFKQIAAIVRSRPRGLFYDA